MEGENREGGPEGGRRGAAPARVLAATLLLSVCFFQTNPSHNEWAHFAPALEFLRTGSWAIDAEAGTLTVDWSRWGGHAWSNKAPGLSMLAVPLLAVLPRDPQHLPASLAILTMLLAGVPTVLAALALFHVAKRITGDERAALLTSAAAGLATMSLPFATALFAHQVVASLLFLSFSLLFFGRMPWLAGFLAGLAVLCDYPAGFGVVGLALYALSRGPKTGALFVAGGLPLLAPMLLYHKTCFDSPWRLPYAGEMPAFMQRDRLVLGMFGAPRPAAIWGLTFSPYRGLFFSSPHLLAAFAGLVVLAKNRYRAEAVLAAGLFAALFLMNSTFFNWDAGGTYGPRYLVPCLPFVSLGFAPVLASRPRLAWLVLPGLAIALVSTATGLIVPPEFPCPLFQWTLPRVFSGDVATTNLLRLRTPWSLIPVLTLWTVAGRMLLGRKSA